LFVVAGGIHITVKGEATPLANVVFLLFGALTSNLIGTTGASMLLIRPWLLMNKYRVTGHHVVFFIFIVSNVGGCLTPVGDPPLYLGYLKGIPFWWVTEHCWPVWTVGVGILLALFYLVDERNYLRAPRQVRQKLAEPADQWRFDGLSNLVFIGLILVAAFIEHPFFLREFLMIGAAAGSYFTTSRQVHDSNHFNFHPIKEVAILFAGISATMMPALDWLQGNAGKMVDPTPAFFFFGSGTLSSVLDNAPTYLTFLSAIFGSFIDQEIVAQIRHLVQTQGVDLDSLTGPHAEQIRQTFAALQKYHSAAVASGNVSVGDISICFLLGNAAYHKFILAISVGSVFFGANTYIGNGPNFMVNTPTFMGYIAKYTLPFMLPMLVIVWWIFFRS
jgi:Na+/H+ antiporter NhaD/arsenite permease-like protein